MSPWEPANPADPYGPCRSTRNPSFVLAQTDTGWQLTAAGGALEWPMANVGGLYLAMDMADEIIDSVTAHLKDRHV